MTRALVARFFDGLVNSDISGLFMQLGAIPGPQTIG
jgi:hypothetical protein